MRECHRQLQRGIRELSRHSPEAALRFFETALNSCPVEDRDDLQRIFYFLGFTLLRLGRRNGAVRSFRAATRLKQRASYSKRMLRRFANDYGMARQATCELDDWHAFYAIHLQRYLRSKQTQRIATASEADMIRDLIGDYWKRIVQRGLLAGRSSLDKLDLFRSVEIVFPYYVFQPGLSEGKVIPVDFLSKTKMTAGDRCRCGSGIPFMMCCGRTRGAEELLRGTF